MSRQEPRAESYSHAAPAGENPLTHLLDTGKKYEPYHLSGALCLSRKDIEKSVKSLKKTMWQENRGLSPVREWVADSL